MSRQPSRVNKYGGISYTASFSERKQLAHACDIWEELYGVRPTNQNVIMNAVNLLTARLEAEKEEI